MIKQSENSSEMMLSLSVVERRCYFASNRGGGCGRTSNQDRSRQVKKAWFSVPSEIFPRFAYTLSPSYTWLFPLSKNTFFSPELFQFEDYPFLSLVYCNKRVLTRFTKIDTYRPKVYKERRYFFFFFFNERNFQRERKRTEECVQTDTFVSNDDDRCDERKSRLRAANVNRARTFFSPLPSLHMHNPHTCGWRTPEIFHVAF